MVNAVTPEESMIRDIEEACEGGTLEHIINTFLYYTKYLCEVSYDATGVFSLIKYDGGILVSYDWILLKEVSDQSPDTIRAIHNLFFK